MSTLYLPLTQTLIILLVVAMLWITQLGFYKGLVDYGKSETKSRKISWYIVLGLFLWLSIIGLSAGFGFFQNFDVVPPRIFFAVFPSVVLTIFLLFSKPFGRFLKTIPPAWLVYIQSFRIVVEIILWLGFLGKVIPFQMTFEGFNYDIVVGLTALLAGGIFFRKNHYRRFEAIIWNVFGLALLVNIVVIAFLSAPSTFRVFMNEPSNEIVAYFPFVWIPGFFVPYAFAMHLFSLKQLILIRENGRTFTFNK